MKEACGPKINQDREVDFEWKTFNYHNGSVCP